MIRPLAGNPTRCMPLMKWVGSMEGDGLKSQAIIISGSAGFVGTHLKAALKQHSPEARILTCDQDVCKELEALSPNDNSATTFIHLAWDLNAVNSVDAQQRCVETLRTLLAQSTALGINRFISIGSATEFGDRDGVLAEAALDNSNAGGPLTPYGQAKRAARALAKEWALAAPDRQVFWLRPFVVYGPQQKGSMLIPYAIDSFLRGEPAEFTKGLQQRDFVYVEDVARAILQAIAADGPGQPFSDINIGTGVGTRVCDVIAYIAAELGAAPLATVGARPDRAIEPARQIASTRRAKQVLHYEAKTDWQTGVRLTIAAAKQAKG